MKARIAMLGVSAVFAASLFMTVPRGGAPAPEGSEILTGEAEGFAGPVKVEVVRLEGDIFSVKVTEQNETPEIGGAAIEPLTTAIAEADSADVDAVAGATVTSNAVMSAVKNALGEDAGDEKDPNAPPGAPVEVEVGGAQGKIKLTVYRDGDTITGIVINDHKESGGIGAMAFEPLIASIMEKQSTEVDNISGATLTSEAVKKAVQDAMSGEAPALPAPDVQFEGTSTEIVAEGYGGKIVMDLYRDGDTITGIVVKSHSESKGIGEAAFEPLFERIVFKNSVDVDNYSGATVTSEAIKSAIQEALGTPADTSPESSPTTNTSEDALEATVDGYGGPLKVAVIKEGDKIQSVTILEHKETPGIGTKAIESLPQAIVKANSADVDKVSGATVTSEAIKKAVKTAIQ